MELRFWWLGLVIAVCLAVWGLAVYWRRKKHPVKRSGGERPLANSWRLLQLQEYQAYIKRYRWLAWLVLAASMVVLLAGIILAARPTTISVVEPEMRNRDIILCLDVSGSMISTDAKIADVYAELAKNFDGERLGLVIFDSSPVVVFPLTDDYDFIAQRLWAVSRYFAPDAADSATLSDEQQELMSDVSNSMRFGIYQGQGSSLVGDGLASCVNRFDKLDSKRSRSIIFGTDNYVAGNPIVTLEEAADYAKEKDIRVYGINPADYSGGSYTTKEAKAFKAAMLQTNGDYYKLDDVAAVGAIVDKVIEQDATRFKGSPQIVRTDVPQVFVYILLSALAVVMVAAWRMKV